MRVVLESNAPLHPRNELERRGDTLCTMAAERMPKGRETTTVIELHPTAG